MPQLLIAMVCTAGLVVLGMANTHHVELSYAFGLPVQIRLVTLMLTAFSAGATCTLFWQMITRLVRNKELRARELMVEARLEAELTKS